MQKDLLNHLDRFQYIPSILSIVSAFLLSACNSNAIAQSSPDVGNMPISVSTSPSSGVGESCTGKPDKTCLAIRFIAYEDSDQNPTVSKSEAARIIRKMNKLFGTCNVHFQISRYETVDPRNYGLAYGEDSQNEAEEIRRTFSDSKDELLAVTTGPWGTAVNGWTNMPGESVYGAIMESSIVGYGDGIIYAHEFGHYLGLDHTSNSSNLMNAVIHTTSTQLTSRQCETIHETILNYWTAMIRR